MFPPILGLLRQDMNKLVHIEVSRQEFIRLYIENGGDKEKASFHAAMSEGLGSHAKIGDKMVKSLGEINETS